MLSAVDQKVDLLIGQVASLQESVSLVLKQLAAIPERFYELLKENEAREARGAIDTARVQYVDQILPVSKNHPSIADFRATHEAKVDLQSVIQDLNRAVGKLRRMEAYGPLTALLMPSAISLVQALLLLRGSEPSDIAARLEQDLHWFDDVANPKLPNSTAAYLVEAASKLKELNDSAAATHFGRALRMQPGATLYDCVGVNDFRAGRPGRNRQGGPGFAELDDYGPGEPARHGPWERMFADVTLEEKSVVVPVSMGPGAARQDVPANYTELVLTRQPSSAAIWAGDPRVSSTPARVQTLDEPDANRRAAIMRDMIEHSPRASDFTALATLLPQIAEQRARITLATTALAVMAEAKPKVEAAIKQLRDA
jgi:hypothetical protein